jgi:hypothetical protein
MKCTCLVELHIRNSRHAIPTKHSAHSFFSAKCPLLTLKISRYAVTVSRKKEDPYKVSVEPTSAVSVYTYDTKLVKKFTSHTAALLNISTWLMKQAVGSAIKECDVGEIGQLSSADSPRWSYLKHDAKSVATPTVYISDSNNYAFLLLWWGFFVSLGACTCSVYQALTPFLEGPRGEASSPQ